jgi:hypothetical protein
LLVERVEGEGEGIVGVPSSVTFIPTRTTYFAPTTKGLIYTLISLKPISFPFLTKEERSFAF